MLSLRHRRHGAAAAQDTADLQPALTGALLAGSAAAMAACLLLHSTTAGIIVAVGVELTGGALTTIKVHSQPGTEPLDAWLILGVAGLLDLPAAAPGVLLAYPAALIVMGVVIPAASALGARNRKVSL